MSIVFVLPTLEERDNLTIPRHGVESAARGGAPGTVDAAAGSWSTSGEDEDWDLEGAVDLGKAKRVGVKRRLQDL